MTREVRALFLAILTLVVYAVSIFISSGALIFPFPLNEFIFLALSLQFLWWNRTEGKWIGMYASMTGICAVMSTQFFWSFIYGHGTLEFLMESPVTDFFLLGCYVLLLVGGMFTIFKQSTTLATLLGICFVLLFSIGVVINSAPLLLIAYATMTVSTQITKVYAPFHLLWILLFILKATEWITFLVNN